MMHSEIIKSHEPDCECIHCHAEKCDCDISECVAKYNLWRRMNWVERFLTGWSD